MDVLTPSPAELGAVANFRIALRRFLAATDEITAHHGLTSRQYDLLAIVHASPEGCTASDLAHLLQLTRNTTTELITRAESKGLVQRVKADADGRLKRVRPTAAGTERYQAAVVDLRPERRRLLGILGAAVSDMTELDRGARSVSGRHSSG